jgi:excisionase family DNA binding protein
VKPPSTCGRGSFEPGNPSNVTGGIELLLKLADDQVEMIARRAAELVPVPVSSPWLDTRGAAEHIAATPDRIHDLVGLGKLTPRRDGRRLLFRREDLDAYLEASG